MSETNGAPKAHPAAAVWPMLPEPDLRRLAEDIAVNGLRHPIVLDNGGLVLDGRNRLAACQIAGVAPEYETYEGDDPIAYVLSANNERRHLSLPERAAATALTLAADGRRVNGRWQRGSVPEAPDNTGSRNNWQASMTSAGLVLDHAPDLLPKVAAGTMALDAAVSQAKKVRDDKARMAELPEDLRALVQTGGLTIGEALRRAKLPERYANLVASGDLDIGEAEHLNEREDREYREAIQRSTDALEGFLHGWVVAAGMHNSPTRNDVLNALSEYDRERFLRIEKETTWPANMI